ncbi:hypothetical protein JCM9279_001890 [Rhodotorula babjevae]
MKTARRKGATAWDLSHAGLANWFARLDVTYGKPLQLHVDNPERTRTSSQPPLSELKPIRLAEMDTTKKYEGRYLLCRAKGPPYMRYGLAFAAEDQDDNLFIAYLRNYHLHGFKHAELDKLFPSGTVLLIREPVFTSSTIKGMPSDVHVASPTDIEVYRPDAVALADVEWASPSSYRPREPGYDPYAAGQAFLEAKQPYLAVQAFTEALARAETQQRTVLVTLERALANLRADQPAAAYHDTSIVLMYYDMGVEMPFEQRNTLMSLRADALTALGLHDRADEVRDDLVAILDDTTTILFHDIDAALTARVRDRDMSDERDALISPQLLKGGKVQRLLEAARSRQDSTLKSKLASESGDYNLLALELAPAPPSKPPCDRLDYRDYVGPIRVAQLKKRNGGRGVIATRDIKPGELLLVEKAFAVANFATIETEEPSAPPDHFSHRPQDTLAVEVAARVLDDPSTLPILESLFDGRDPPTQALVFNALSQRTVPEYASPPINLDMDWVERICATNGFNFLPPDLFDHDPRYWSALFLNGSAFNHSCLPNTYHKSVGDLLVVRARVFVKKGKEVYISYAPIDVTPPMSRWAVLERHFEPNECPCAYCVETKNDEEDELGNRASLLAEFDGASDAVLDDGARSAEMCAKEYVELSRILADVCDTYMGDNNIKPARRAAWSNACDAAGAWPDMRDGVWSFDPAPLCWTEQVMEATLDYARACDVEGSAAAQAHALALVTVAANQSRVEHGDDVEQFWQRWIEELVGLEQYKERVVERMAKRES